MLRNLILFLLAVALVVVGISLLPSPVVQSSDSETITINPGKTDKKLSTWLLQMEGDWESNVSETPGLVTTEGIGYIEADMISGTWNGIRWNYYFKGGSYLNFRDETNGLYVDVTYTEGNTETVILAEK